MAARTPFRVHLLKSKSQHHKYECCAVNGSALYIGTGDGSIVRYDVRTNPGSHEYECQGSSLARVSPSKRPISQLGPIAELRSMLTLCDGSILVLNLEELETQISIIRCKDVACFAVKKERNVYYLAALTRRRVVSIFEHRRDADEWSFMKELNVPDGARTINWSGRNVLVGFKKEYVLLDINDSRPKMTVPMGKGSVPLVCNMDTMKEVIVAVEGSLGVRMDAETCKPTSTFAIRWASLPTSVVYVHPFTLSVVDGNAVEVHYPFRRDSGGDGAAMSGGTASFCQSLPIKYADKVSTPCVLDNDWPRPGGGKVREVLTPVGRGEVIIVTTTDNCIYLIEMQSIPDQVTALFRAQQYEEALELCNLCQSESSQLLTELRMHYANYYFGLKKFGDAFAQFVECSADPRLVVTYFHSLVLPSLQQMNKPALRIHNQCSTATFAKDTRDDAVRALIGHLMKLRKPPPPKDEAGTPCFTTTLSDVLNDDAKQIAAITDTALLQAYLLIDMEEDALVLLTRPNQVLREDALQFLRQQEEHVCVIALLNSIGEYRQSLTTLRNLGDHGTADGNASMWRDSLTQTPGAIYFKKLVEKDLPIKLTPRRTIRGIVEQTEREHVPEIVGQVLGVMMTVFTIKMLDGETHQDLVKEFSRWVLVNFPPEFTVKMFTEAAAPMKAALIAHFLEGIPDLPPTVTAYFLERTLGHRCDLTVDRELHNKRVNSLLAVIASGNDKLLNLEKLHVFLRTSQYYTPEEALVALTQSKQVSELTAQRAVVFKRLGQHNAAVKMFLATKNGFDQAVAYANEVSEAGPNGTILDTKGEAYRALLETLVRPQEGEARTAEALELVNRHPHVDVAVALEILPDDTPVAQLDDFIKNALRAKHARARELEVHKNSLESLRRQNLVTLTRHKMHRATIDHETRCTVCRKLIRDTVFARYPNGVVVHQACLVDDHICPQTGVDFTKSIETLMV